MTDIPTHADDRVLRLRDVEAATGLSRSTIYALAQRGEFPAPRRLTPRASGWLASEVQRWLADRPPSITARRSA
ncbi:MAG: AlpA family transcriptional regulator [Steroidobacteraceae bacterium]|nr:AlpA family transcriptional regulator [Steroidobacteraceae bacterium]